MGDMLIELFKQAAMTTQEMGDAMQRLGQTLRTHPASTPIIYKPKTFPMRSDAGEAHVAIIKNLPAGTVLRICCPDRLDSGWGVEKIRNKVESVKDLIVVKNGLVVEELAPYQLAHEATDVLHAL